MIERLKRDKELFEQGLKQMTDRARDLEAELAALSRDIGVNQGALAYVMQLLGEPPPPESTPPDPTEPGPAKPEPVA